MNNGDHPPVHARLRAETDAKENGFASEPIAIVGIGGIFPGAADIPTFWQNIVRKIDSIIEVPKDRWDWKLYYDPDTSAPDKTYSKIGGFVLDFKFDPLKLRIPPPVAQQMDMVQKMAVAATAEALRDSGYDRKAYDSERVAVILGNSMGGTKKEATDMRVYSAFFKNRLEDSPAFCRLPAASRNSILAEMDQRVKSGLATITEDTMPGELSNVIAGRVANTFNFNGANFTVDAACASSLAALDQAANGLRSREYDMVFCGGVDQMMSPPAYVKFCKIGALSPDGSRPFDAGANGFVMGEGAGVCALKRLSDALRDGDRIYALVRAVGSSSDGRGKGVTAPNPRGQRMAMERAFAQVDYTPGDIGLLEAHGTSTKVGDVVEANTSAEIFRDHAPKQSIGLGSVKSQIGHLKAAAGVASLIKAALAIHHKTLPPSIHFRTPNPGIDWDHSPFFVVTEPKEWGGRKPRRANVSSFGFGGTNFHVALEEATAATTARWTIAGKAAQSRPAASEIPPDNAPEAPEIDPEFSEIELPPSVLNTNINPSIVGEVFFIHGATPDAVFDRLSALLKKIPQQDVELFAFAAETNAHFKRDEYCLCLAVESAAKLREKIDFILKTRNPGLWEKTPPTFKPKGIYLGRRKKPGKIGMLFPGQGSQYVDMLRDLKEKYSIVADTFVEADRILLEAAGYKLTDVLFTRGGETPEQLAVLEDKIKQTEITQPAVLTADVAILRLLQAYGVKPDIVCGHSLGEYGALVASGVLTFKDALLAVSARAKEMADIQVPDHGKMASVAAPIDKIEPVLKKIKGYVAPANKNCPSQTVIAGDSRAVEAAVKAFGALGIQAQEIRVSHAFHSKIVAPAQAPYRKFFERISLSAPRIPLLSNATAAYYPDDIAEIRELLVAQIASPVEFIRQVERMYEDGVRLFVEAGPKRVLTAFVTNTLEGKKDAAALSSNHPKRGGILEFNDLLARLVAEGVDLDMPTETGTEMNSSSSLSPARGRRTNLVQQNWKNLETLEQWGFYTGSVVVSGIAAGTPGAWDRVFRQGNLDQIIRGQNLIGKLSEQDVQSQLNKNIVRLIKSADGDHHFERIRNAAEVVQLAALAGEFDLAREFGFKESVANAMDISSKLAVAAGMLALQDAGIPLVPVYKETTTGSKLHTGWNLPDNMRDETGIIFATAYPSIDSMASEVSRYLADKYRHKPLRELATLLESLISRLKDPADRAAVESWYASSFHAYQERYGDQGPYEFSREFMFKILPLGHCQLAQWIGARGPSTQIGAACASTTQAVAIAEDWIRLGRAQRVIVIAGDNVTSPNLREWMLTGFLAAGAATTTGVVSEAALPFDRRRHGMILGMGAAGLVIEQSSKTQERGMKPLTEILATQYENSAFHVTRLQVDHVSHVMDRLVAKAERRWGLDRKEIASKALFMSHETYTPARGGSASAEVQALMHTFGPDAEKIVVTNTKGFTGHTMGASIEDPLVIRALTTGQVPPIANYREPDPDLAGINLSRGGEYDLEYAIRLGAGFGSQIAMTLMKRVLTKGEKQIVDPTRHQEWLRKISGQAHPEPEIVANTLRIRDIKTAASRQPLEAALPRDNARSGTSSAGPSRAPAPKSVAYTPGENLSPLAQSLRAISESALPVSSASTAVMTAGSNVKSLSLNQQEVQQTIVQLVSEKTGYPAEMLELDLDMEADLGIDTVKQAELIGIIREKYSIPRQENLALKNYPTLRHVIRFVMDSTGNNAGVLAKPEPQVNFAPVVFQKPDEKINATVDATIIKRWVLKAITKPLPPNVSAGERFLAKGHDVAILCSKPETAKPFIQAFKTIGIPATVLKSPDQSASKSQGLLHLGGLELTEPKSLFSKSLDSQYPQAVRSLFLAVKAKQKDLDAENHWIVALTRREDHPLAGAIAGLIKAISKELPKAKIQAIDFDVEAPIQEIVKIFLAELRADEKETEIRYVQGKRHVFRLVEEVLPDSTTQSSTPQQPIARSLNKNSVVVITGGGQGLGAECAKAIAARYQSQLLILGRTPLVSQAKQWAALDEVGLKNLKQQLWEKLKADKSKKPTPALLEREFSPIIKAATLYRNLETMRASGSQVTYIDADLADAQKVQAAVKKMGGLKPDIILHAAGLEESKMLADKTPERFDAIFRAKAHAAAHLLDYLPPRKGQVWVFFSSVVGRFGNIGQTDYASASDFLAKLAENLQTRKIQAVTVDLTAISDIGMAMRGGVELFLKSQGVDFMPPDRAVDMILAEALHNTGDAEVMFAGKLGRLDSENQMREASTQNPPIPTNSTPLIHKRTFSLQNDPWLSDHAIAGIPYVAGVMGLELFAETARKMTGEIPIGFEDVRFSLPIKLLRQKPVEVRSIGKTVSVNGAQQIELHLESDFITPQGLKLGGPRTHFTAKASNDISVKSRVPARPLGQFQPTDRWPTEIVVPPQTIYSAYFHGPSFQVLGGILSLSEEKIIAAYRQPSKPLWQDQGRSLIFHPMLIEAAFQTCGYRDLHYSKKTTLPDSIGRIAVWNHSHPKELYVFAQYKGPDKDGKSVYDAWVADEKKRVSVELKDYKMVPIA